MKQPKKEPTVNHWKTRPAVDKTPIPMSYYYKPLDGMHRVYANVPATDYYQQYEHNNDMYKQYYGGQNALQEYYFDDGRGWRPAHHTLIG